MVTGHALRCACGVLGMGNWLGMDIWSGLLTIGRISKKIGRVLYSTLSSAEAILAEAILNFEADQAVRLRQVWLQLRLSTSRRGMSFLLSASRAL